MGDPRIDRIAARQAAQTTASRLTVGPLIADVRGCRVGVGDRRQRVVTVGLSRRLEEGGLGLNA